MPYEYIAQNRKGDHICYISDLSKIRSHYPAWDIKKSLKLTSLEIYKALQIGREASPERPSFSLHRP